MHGIKSILQGHRYKGYELELLLSHKYVQGSSEELLFKQ